MASIQGQTIRQLVEALATPRIGFSGSSRLSRLAQFRIECRSPPAIQVGCSTQGRLLNSTGTSTWGSSSGKYRSLCSVQAKSAESSASGEAAPRAQKDKIMDSVPALEAAAAEATPGAISAPAALMEAPVSAIGPDLALIYASCQTYVWRGYKVNYVKQGSGPAILLVHGFGASIGHWRNNIPVLAQAHSVFALDLLGQGASQKPPKFVYTIEGWAELIVDFLREVVGEPAVLVGNSIGSLAALVASAEAAEGMVSGTVLLNCAGGMNNKAIADDWRIRLALPLFWLIDWLLLQPAVAGPLFNRFRSRENVKTVLQSVYSNKGAVDDELVEVILKPADDEGALDAFVAIITGPPGPRPEQLVPKIQHPILLLWGDEDPFTPFDGPIGRYFRSLPTTCANVEFVELNMVGHCPHDDKPELVHASLLPWLARVHTPKVVVAR